MCLVQGHSLIHSFNKYLLHVHHVLGIVLLVEITAMSEADVVAFMDLYSNGKGDIK